MLDTELLAALEVVEEDVVGLLRHIWVCAGEVDEVAAMRDDVSCCVVFVFQEMRAECITVLNFQRGVIPLSLGFQEAREGVAADVYAIDDGILNAFSYGGMGSNEHS